jgi:hypothetical protein
VFECILFHGCPKVPLHTLVFVFNQVYGSGRRFYEPFRNVIDWVDVMLKIISEKLFS